MRTPLPFATSARLSHSQCQQTTTRDSMRPRTLSKSVPISDRPPDHRVLTSLDANSLCVISRTPCHEPRRNRSPAFSTRIQIPETIRYLKSLNSRHPSKGQGSIPLISTGKRRSLAAMRDFFRFGPPCESFPDSRGRLRFRRLHDRIRSPRVNSDRHDEHAWIHTSRAFARSEPGGAERS
jgi:hypothetical protein